MGRLDGKVALITGLARGQGRSHALRMAEEGADIVGIDVCSQVSSVPYPMPEPAEIAETVRLVEATGRRIIARQGDVRSEEDLASIVKEGVNEFGHIDIVCANAGILSMAPSWELTEDVFHEMIDVNLTGVWRTAKAVIPTMIEQGTGGSIIMTSSFLGINGQMNVAHYAAAKHGVIGLMRCMANELGQHKIRVNVVAPGTVGSGMTQNQAVYNLFCPDLENPTQEHVAETILRKLNLLNVDYIDPRDISNAMVFLGSEESRFVTGIVVPVDAGWDVMTL